MADYMEGNLPEFRCMNEHYGITFEKGEAGEDSADGFLTSEKVLNWDILEPTYTDLEGIVSFEPTAESVVGTSTVFTAARKDDDDSFHYFFSVPASEVDPDSCPEPCTGHIIYYFWSITPGTVYLFGKVSTDADTPPCWLPMYDEVNDGPPPAGVTTWDSQCIIDLVDELEESKTSYTENSSSADTDNIAVVAASTADESSGNAVNVVAALMIPAALIFCIASAVAVTIKQRARRKKKVRDTEQALGVGKYAVDASASTETSPGGVIPPYADSGRACV
ncbi:unnamed protein product [Sphacelaria rigidula]